MRHLQARTAEPALDVEALVGFAAVEDALVAADLGGNVIEGLDEAEAELLALLILSNSDVFDVANVAEAMDARKGEEIMLATFIHDSEKMPRGGRKTYNFFSTISAPVPTTEFCDRLVSSMTIM
jgi:hypothetical protein